MKEPQKFEEWVWINYPFVSKMYEAYLNEISFTEETAWETWWNTYGKKVGTKNCKQKFSKIKKSLYAHVIDHTRRYVAATPNKKYRMNPLTYLNGEYYNDEGTIEEAIERNKPKGNRASEAIQQASSNVAEWAQYLSEDPQ